MLSGRRPVVLSTPRASSNEFEDSKGLVSQTDMIELWLVCHRTSMSQLFSTCCDIAF